MTLIGIDGVYSRYLMKGEKGFVYLSLKIKSEWVDVNIHPTKKQVRFLNEDKITESVCRLIQSKLESAGTSKEFMVQVCILYVISSHSFIHSFTQVHLTFTRL